MVNYEDMQQLIAFSNTDTLANVAEQFHISQPSVTRNMKKLEHEFGVALFERTKNSITLNDVGLRAVDESVIVVKQMQDMIKRVKDYDRAKRTVSLGSCAAVPVSTLNARIISFFPDSTLATDVRPIDELIEGLLDNTYQIIVLPFQPNDSSCCEVKIGEEHLMFHLPKTHHFADAPTLTLSDMNGENILLYERIGFWYDIIKEKMPDSKFLVQNERYTFMELVKNSIMPSFVTDVTLQAGTQDDNRIAIPITDSEVNISYYLVCKKENKKRFSAFF